MSAPLLPPIGMLAELTHRCPLQCPYCSNPTELLKANRELDTETWLALFDQAADLGVLQVHLSGGEPTLRRDLEQLVSGLSRRGVYTNLITAGVGIAEGRIEALAKAGLDHLQLSFQGARAATTARIGNLQGSHEKKLETARRARAAGLPLTINASAISDSSFRPSSPSAEPPMTSARRAITSAREPPPAATKARTDSAALAPSLAPGVKAPDSSLRPSPSR